MKAEATTTGAVGKRQDEGDRHHYGRRVEPDRTWTVYHVFNGAPARAEGKVMKGLSRSEATMGMVSLNRFGVQGATEKKEGGRGAPLLR